MEAPSELPALPRLLEFSAKVELGAVLRAGEPSFDLESMLDRFDRLWWPRV